MLGVRATLSLLREGHLVTTPMNSAGYRDTTVHRLTEILRSQSYYTARRYNSAQRRYSAQSYYSAQSKVTGPRPQDVCDIHRVRVQDKSVKHVLIGTGRGDDSGVR